MESDEVFLRQGAERLEKRINKSPLLYSDPQLEEYLAKVTQKLHPPSAANPDFAPRVMVIKNPHPNAFALAHGAIYLHLGILGLLENEAQLAALLAHELTHITHRHTLRKIRHMENEEALRKAIQAVLASTGLGLILLLKNEDLNKMAALTAFSGYSRELEKEADTEALRLLVRAGYDGREAPKFLERMLSEPDPGKEEKSQPDYFRTHPPLPERIRGCRQLLEQEFSSAIAGPPAEGESSEFLAHRDRLLLDIAAADLDAGRFHSARRILERKLQLSPESARGHFLLGEWYRRSKPEDPDYARVLAAYRDAIRLDADFAEPHRELGLLYRELKQPGEAIQAFEAYLALNPDAADTPIIRGFMKEMRKP